MCLLLLQRGDQGSELHYLPNESDDRRYAIMMQIMKVPLNVVIRTTTERVEACGMHGWIVTWEMNVNACVCVCQLLCV